MPNKSISILYLDDEPSNLRIFKTAFKRQYKVFIAETVDAALAILAQEEIHIIISDQRMPQMTGSEFLSLIKDEYPNAVRMILTGYCNMNSIMEGIEAGWIYKYIAKPWQKDAMGDILQEAAQRSHVNRSAKKHANYLENRAFDLKKEVKNLRQELKNKESLIQLFPSRLATQH